MNITWKYKIDLADEAVFAEIEKEWGRAVPQKVRELARECNGATPSRYNFMAGSTERVVGAVLSFNKNEEDTDTIYTAMDVVEDKNLMPFGIDPFGNYICCQISDGKVVFWDHETGTVTTTDQDMGEFLEGLY